MTRQRKPEETYCNFENFSWAVGSKTDINQDEVQIIKNLSRIWVLTNHLFLISQNIHAELKGPKIKYKKSVYIHLEKLDVLFHICPTAICSHLMRLYLPHRRPAKAQASLHIRAVSPEPSLFAHMKNGGRRMVWPKIRHLAQLDGFACAFEEWVYGERKVPWSYELAHLGNFRCSDLHDQQNILKTCAWLLK